MWTRRDLLRAVGAGATLAALGPGCGAAARPALDGPGIERDGLRDALRAAVEVAGTRLDAPFAFATVRRRVRAIVDLDQRGLHVDERAVVIVGGRDAGGRWHERGSDDLSAAGVAALATHVAAASSGPAAGRRTAAARTPRDATLVERDPRAVSRATWLAEADRLAARVGDHASSRVIYRAAWLVSDDDETWIVRRDVDHRERRVRGQVGVALVAWQGGRPIAGEAVRAARGVPAAAQLDDDALARAAADALMQFTPGGAPSGATTVVLAPAVVAAVVDRLLAAPAVAARVRPAAALTVVDDPAAPAAFAGHLIDDDGDPARPRTVAAAGQPLAAEGGSARRHGPHWQRTRGPVHVDVAAGSAASAALEATVVAGVALDGPRDVHLGADGRLVVRAARARELARGQRTGRVWADLELRADAGELLAGVTGVSHDRLAVAITEEGPPRGALVPWLVTRGELAGGEGDQR